MTRCADGLAVGPDPAATATAAVRQARDGLDGAAPDLALVFVGGLGPAESADALSAAHAALGARTVIGCSAAGVVGAGRVVADGPAVSVWAASLPGARLRSFHLEVMRTSDAWAVVGMPVRRDDDVVGALLADPWSFPVEGFVSASRAAASPLPLVGGMGHGASGPSSTRLLVDGVLHDRGAAGVLLGGVSARPLVSPGHRPFGDPMTVTASDGRRLLALAGAPATVRLQQAVAGLAPADRALADHGVMVGIAVDEYLDEHGAQEMVVRSVLEADGGAIVLHDPVPVGTTVRFCLVDPQAASEYLVDALERLRVETDAEGGLEGALVMTCVDRFSAAPELLVRDVAAVSRLLGVGAVAGMLSTGEIGPVRGGNHVHGLGSAVLALGARRPAVARRPPGTASLDELP